MAGLKSKQQMTNEKKNLELIELRGINKVSLV